MSDNANRLNYGMPNEVPTQEAEMSGQIPRNQPFPRDYPIMPRNVEELRFPQVSQNMGPQQYRNNVRPLEEVSRNMVPQQYRNNVRPLEEPQHYGNSQHGRATQGQYECEQPGRSWHTQPDVRYFQPHVPRQTSSYAQQIPNESTLQLQSYLQRPPYLPPQFNSLSGHQQQLLNERRQQMKRLYKPQEHPYNEPGRAELQRNIRQIETNRPSQPFQSSKPDSSNENEYLQQRHFQQSGNLSQMQNVPHSSNVRQPLSHNSLSYIDQPSHMLSEQQQQSYNDHYLPQPYVSNPQLQSGCCLEQSCCQHMRKTQDRASRSPLEQKYVPRSTFKNLGSVAPPSMTEVTKVWLKELNDIRIKLNDLFHHIQKLHNSGVNFLNGVPNDVISLESSSDQDEQAGNDSPETSDCDV